MSRQNGTAMQSTSDYTQLSKWLDDINTIQHNTTLFDVRFNNYTTNNGLLLKQHKYHGVTHINNNNETNNQVNGNNNEYVTNLIANSQYPQLLQYIQQHKYMKPNVLIELCDAQIHSHDQVIQQYCSEFGIELIPDSQHTLQLQQSIDSMQSMAHTLHNEYNMKSYQLYQQYTKYNAVLIEKYNIEQTIKQISQLQSIMHLLDRINTAADNTQYMYYFKLYQQIIPMLQPYSNCNVVNDVQQYIQQQRISVTESIRHSYDIYVDNLLTLSRQYGRRLYNTTKYNTTLAQLIVLNQFDQIYYVNPKYVQQYKTTRQHQLEQIFDQYTFHGSHMNSDVKNLLIDLYGYYSVEQYIMNQIDYMYGKDELMLTYTATIKRLISVCNTQFIHITDIQQLLTMKKLITIFIDTVDTELHYNTTVLDHYIHHQLLSLYCRLICIDKQVELNTNYVQQFAETKYIIGSTSQYNELQQKYHIELDQKQYPIECSFTENLLFVIDQVYQFVELYLQYTTDVQYSTLYLMQYVNEIYFLSVKKSISFYAKNINHMVQLYHNHIYFNQWFLTNSHQLFLPNNPHGPYDDIEPPADNNDIQLQNDVFINIQGYIYTLINETILENTNTEIKLYLNSIEHNKLSNNTNLNITELLTYITQINRLIHEFTLLQQQDIMTGIFMQLLDVYDEILFKTTIIKKVTYLTLYNLQIDIKSIIEYINMNHISMNTGVTHKLNEYQQYVQIITSNDILHYTQHKSNYISVTVYQLLLLLDKYTDLSMMNTTNYTNINIIKKKQIQQIIKQFRPQT